MSEHSLAEDAARLLHPLIGIRGSYSGHTLELIDVLADGPTVALMEISSNPRIQTNQFGDALSRQPRILSIPVVSEIEADAHPVLRALLPEAALGELRILIQAHRGGEQPVELGRP